MGAGPRRGSFEPIRVLRFDGGGAFPRRLRPFFPSLKQCWGPSSVDPGPFEAPGRLSDFCGPSPTLAQAANLRAPFREGCGAVAHLPSPWMGFPALGRCVRVCVYVNILWGVEVRLHVQRLAVSALLVSEDFSRRACS